MSVSRNGVYKIYDHMHVAFPRIIPRIMPPNHTRESYLRNIPPDQQGRAKHTPKHTPESYLRNIPRIIPPDATRFAGHGVFGKGQIVETHEFGVGDRRHWIIHSVGGRNEFYQLRYTPTHGLMLFISTSAVSINSIMS